MYKLHLSFGELLLVKTGSEVHLCLHEGFTCYWNTVDIVWVHVKWPFWYLLSSCSVALDNSGARNNRALVQYIFDGPEAEVKVKPHGNSKQSTPYFRTSESAREATRNDILQSLRLIS